MTSMTVVEAACDCGGAVVGLPLLLVVEEDERTLLVVLTLLASCRWWSKLMRTASVEARSCVRPRGVQSMARPAVRFRGSRKSTQTSA